MSQAEDFPEATQKQSSGCLKWVLVFLALGAVCGLACCGLVGYFAYQFKPTIVTTSPEVRQMAAEMVPFEIPDEFVGLEGVKVDNFMVAVLMCRFERQDGRGRLQLMEVQVKFGDPAEHEAQFKQQFRQQDGQELPTLTITSSEEREVTMNGQPTELTFAEGTDPETGTPYREVRGQFTGKNGMGTLHLQVEEDVWDEEAVLRMLSGAP
jgi:hypothetical protein